MYKQFIVVTNLVFRRFFLNAGSHFPDPSRLPPSVREMGSLKLTGPYQWYHLGLQLGVEGHVLDQIEENYPRDSQMRKNKMFGAWLRRDPEASWEKLASALSCLGENRLVNFIHGMF